MKINSPLLLLLGTILSIFWFTNGMHVVVNQAGGDQQINNYFFEPRDGTPFVPIPSPNKR